MEREWGRARAIIGDATLQPIQNTVKNETNKKDDKNTSNHGASNCNSDFKGRHRHRNKSVDKPGKGTDTVNADVEERTDPGTK